jgi:hypothetical protein
MMKDAKRFVFGLALFLSLAALPVLAEGQAKVGKQTSRLVVSFYSICCGINQQAQEKLDAFINDYGKAKGRQLTKKAAHWGKEGEIDYCLKLSELSLRERKRFVSKVRSLLKGAKLVHIRENAPCMSER